MNMEEYFDRLKKMAKNQHGHAPKSGPSPQDVKKTSEHQPNEI